VFDHSAPDAEHLQDFLFHANPEILGHFPAINQLFGIFLPNAAPTVMRAAFRGKRSVGVATMNPPSVSSPLALRPREAAKALGISPRFLWQLTTDGHIPCVRVGSGKRRTVLYPLAELQAWLTRQAATAKGGEHDPR
jgi:excisionase family DNA binding protein